MIQSFAVFSRTVCRHKSLNYGTFTGFPAPAPPNSFPSGGFPGNQPSGGFPNNQPSGGFPFGGGFSNPQPSGGFGTERSSELEAPEFEAP